MVYGPTPMEPMSMRSTVTGSSVRFSTFTRTTMGTDVAVRGCAELTSIRATPMAGSAGFLSAGAAAAAADVVAEPEASDAGADAQADIINGAHTASTQRGTRMSADGSTFGVRQSQADPEKNAPARMAGASVHSEESDHQSIPWYRHP